MKILKPIQNSRKKRLTFTKCSNFMLPKISVLNVAVCSFKTYFLDIPFVGTLELVIQK